MKEPFYNNFPESIGTMKCILDIHMTQSNTRCDLMHLKCDEHSTPEHLLLDSAPGLGPLISRWEINKFKTC